MKEIIAIIRPGKIRQTREALAKAGVLTCTSTRVFGRGKQRGLRYATISNGFVGAQEVVMRYLPKKMLYLVVSDHQLKTVVQAIIRSNQTGQFGDGKIFVMETQAVYRIRTEEKNEVAIR